MPERKSYIEFKEGVAPRGCITKVWNVLSKSSSETLGQIRWYSNWRCYCFYPNGGTIWSNDCLKNVQKFCARQNYFRRMEREEAKSG